MTTRSAWSHRAVKISVLVPGAVARWAKRLHDTGLYGPRMADTYRILLADAIVDKGCLALSLEELQHAGPPAARVRRRKRVPLKENA